MAAFAVAVIVAIAAVVIHLRYRATVSTANSANDSGAALALAQQQAARVPELEAELARVRQSYQETAIQLAAAQAQAAEERKGAQEKLAMLEDARGRLSQSFEALSADALRKNNQSFLELAKETLTTFQESAKSDLEKRQQAIVDFVSPVKESLAKVDAQMHEIEKTRIGAYESLQTQVRSLLEIQQQLRSETGNLVKALRSPNVRGRWGEVQLRRVVEMAGMVDHCDFREQQSASDGEGGTLRPDLIVHLPAGKTIVVDSKAPISAYMDALDAPDDAARAECLARHAMQVRARIDELSRKAYWEQFTPTPEFVVLFLPGEMFFSAALERDPSLIEFGAEKRVILSTPTTLIALLKAIYFGWRQQALAENAQKISETGRDLYTRLGTMGQHFEAVGASLSRSVDSYNKAVASLETRVMVSARKMKELDTGLPASEAEPLKQIEHIPRQLQAPELLNAETRMLGALEENAGE